MKARIWCWALAFWNDAAHAQFQNSGWCGLKSWKGRIARDFSPTETFVACGSWSDPKLNPIPGTTVINAGLPQGKVYYGQRYHLGKCAFTAAMAHALNHAEEWDLLVMLDTDAFLGEINLPELFAEFQARPELLLAPAWCGYIGGPFMVWKRMGAVRLLHQRPYANIVDDDEPDLPTLWEQECLLIYRKGMWWNPWPGISSMLYDSKVPDEIAMTWPTIGKPAPHLIEPYIQKHLKKRVPL